MGNRNLLFLALALCASAACADPSADADPFGAAGEALAALAPTVVKDLATVAGASPSAVAAFVPVGARTFFAADSAPYGRELWVTDGTVEGTRLVLDVHPGGAGSAPTELTPLGDRLVFAADDGARGAELWITDGTAAGTALLRDIRPGVAGSQPANLAAAGALVVFFADDGATGAELWKTDGTPAGTTLVRDLRPGSASPSGVQRPVRVGATAKLVFPLSDGGAAGVEPWVTDGTSDGTRMLADLKAGSAASSPTGFVRTGEKVFFTAIDKASSSGRELAVTDGTPAGTRYLEISASGASSPANLCPVGDTLFLAANANSLGAELYRSDGTTDGTVLVRDIHPGPSGSSPSWLTAVGARVFFSADEGPAGAGVEPWVSDGTAAGTWRVADLNPGSSSSSPAELRAAGNRLFFTATDASGGKGLWLTDGAAEGTRRLGAGGVIDPAGLTVVGGRLYLRGSGAGGVEPWTSDGTEAGTVALGDLNRGAGGSGAAYFAAAGDGVVFRADDGTGDEPWVLPGGAGAPRKVDVNPPQSSAFAPVNSTTATTERFATLGARLLFAAAGDGNFGKELYASDGTEAGTGLVRDIQPTAGIGSNPTGLVVLGSRALFAANGGTGAGGEEPWTTDGTPAGTTLLRDVYAGSTGSAPRDLVLAGSRVLFSAATSAAGRELWRTDGRTDGTALVADLYAGSSGSNAAGLVPFAGGVLFAATTGTGTGGLGNELWFSDGTEAGTRLVRDLAPGPASADPDSVVVLGGIACFAARNDAVGREVWCTDGTEAGTRLLVDGNPGAASGAPARLVISGDRLFFVLDDGAHGAELWTSDGTTAGTRLVRDIWPGPGSSGPDALVDAFGTLYFAASDPQGGRELWKSDGTEAGTVLVRDLFEGARPSNPTALLAVGANVLFAAADEAHGRELWWSDGTAAGTRLVADLWAGAGASDPDRLAFFGDRAVFVAATDALGREVFQLPLPPDATPPRVQCPADVSVVSPVPGNATVAFPPAAARDDRSGPVTVSYTPASGSAFAPGTTTVLVTASDAAGNTSACTFRVTVAYVDGVAPVIVCPPDQAVVAESPSGAAVSWPPATATDDVTATLVPWYSRASGSVFPVGTTSVTATVRDAAGNHADCTFTVRVRYDDVTPPTVVCPADYEVVTSTRAGATVLYPLLAATDNVPGIVFIEYAPPSGGLLPVGTTTVLQTGRDAAGNTAQCTFRVTVVFVDRAAPSLLCPADVRVESATDGADVVLPQASVADDSGAAPTVVYAPASGTRFAQGTTPVVVTATDAAGNRASCTFRVVVAPPDLAPPQITCPADVARTTRTDAPLAVVFQSATATDDRDTDVAVVYSRPSGAGFAVGTTTVTATATDDAGRTATCSFSVTVTLVDDTNPVVACPANVTHTTYVNEAAVVAYAPATATDNLDAQVSIAYSKASGSAFPIGATTVVATATDDFANTATCSFTVTVVLDDVTAPQIDCPDNIAVDTYTDGPLPVSYPPAVATDNLDADVAVAYSLDSGTDFPVGSTPVVATATDDFGNRAQCMFLVQVTLADVTAPAIICPADVAVNATVAAGALATFRATATDNLDADVAITYSAASGATFAPGTTAVTATARDDHGNEASCTFDVVVTLVDTTAPIVRCPSSRTATAHEKSGVAVPFPDATAEDNLDASPGITYDHAPGSVFPVGFTSVTATAEDDFGNQATCTFGVTVVLVDIEAPALACPASLTKTAEEPTGLEVTYPAATATDDIDVEPTIESYPGSGSRFPVGTTTVTVLAFDAAGNRGRCTFEVTVEEPGGCGCAGTPASALLLLGLAALRRRRARAEA